MTCCCVAALSLFKTTLLNAAQFRTICCTCVVTTNYDCCSYLLVYCREKKYKSTRPRNSDEKYERLVTVFAYILLVEWRSFLKYDARLTSSLSEHSNSNHMLTRRTLKQERVSNVELYVYWTNTLAHPAFHGTVTLHKSQSSASVQVLIQYNGIWFSA